MVWSHLQLYVAECPSKPNDLLFRSRNGKPIVWRDKKKPGAEQGRSSYTKSSALRMAWVRLLKRSKANWSGRFYTLRSLGGTSFGSRPDVSIVALRDFMGHKSINTTNRYLRAVTPRNRRLVEWITRTLDKDNPEAWRESVK